MNPDNALGPEPVGMVLIDGVEWYQTKYVDELGSEVYVCVLKRDIEERFELAKKAVLHFKNEGWVVTSALLLPDQTRIQVLPLPENA